MKKLILVRHGNYGYDMHLDRLGRDQIAKLAEKLKTFIDEGSVEIFTSTAPRAIESAEILSSFFGVKHEPHEVFWSDNSHRENYKEALEVIRSRAEVDVLIVVTHYEYVSGFPVYFTQKELNTLLFSGNIKKGNAVVVDCLGKVLIHVGPY